MDVQTIKKYVGKKVLIILRNNFQYTATIPQFEGSAFSIKDKFGEDVDIECEFIAFVKEMKPMGAGI